MAKVPQKPMNMSLVDRIAVADANGLIVADTAGRILNTVHPARHLQNGIAIMDGPERVGTVLVGSMIDSSLSGLDETFLNSVLRSLIYAVLIAAAVALIFGLVFSANITKPVLTLNEAAKKVAGGNFEIEVPPKGDEEIATLARSFNTMTAELKRLEDAKKQIIADVAHELRTPVTLIQGSLEGIIDGVFPMNKAVLNSVYEETVRLSRLIDTLKELEIIESGKLDLALSPVDVGKMIENTLILFESFARDKNIDLGMNPIASPLTVTADSSRLSEVLYNLLSNAIKYTPASGSVRVGAYKDNVSDVGILQVDDSGPGIPPEERERIFERFYRLDKSRSSNLGGRGLGLAIASQIVKAHGGRIRVEDSELGGASFRVELKSRSVS
jgi:two-component system OmpR family sensor kinase/two-component system sensor histidine kinase BaeS